MKKKNAFLPQLIKKEYLNIFAICGILITTSITAQLPTAKQITSKMRIGWNLGNTLEATWATPGTASQRLIDSVKAAGFNSVRLPCAWFNNSDTNTCIINPAYFDLVKKNVDYCIKDSMYVMINIHWDKGWLENRINVRDSAKVNARQKAYWTQIANYFKDYDEHLLFACANEPNVDNNGTNLPVLNSYIQTFIKAVRATGGNNSSRTLIFQGHPDYSTIPKDEIADRLIFEAHSYGYQFALLDQDKLNPWCGGCKDTLYCIYYWGKGNHSLTDLKHNPQPPYDEEADLDKFFGTTLKTRFVDKGVPVILGEYGAWKRGTLASGADRALHYKSVEYYYYYIVKSALKNGAIPFVWDIGSLFDRSTGVAPDWGIINAMKKGAKEAEEYDAPGFVQASVTDTNPKQIQVVLSKAIADSGLFKGFTVKIDGNVATLDSVVLRDTSKVAIYINQSISKDNAITLSYSNGNVFATSNGKKLIPFTDKIVDNLLKGASPRIIEAKTDINGGALILKFNKKMQLPTNVSALTLNAVYNGQITIPILLGSFLNNDSTTLSFPLNKTVYRDYTLLVTYTGSNFASADNGLLKPVTDFPVTNISNGLPVHITSGKIGTDGITLSLEFSKPMVLTSSPNFVLTINGSNVAFSGYSVSNNTIQLTLSKYLHVGDSVKLSYTPGTIKAVDNGPLDAIANFTISNQVAPVWITVPGKIEAENFASKFGTLKAETTSDVGGGQNIGYIANGNWLEYAIENNSIKTNYPISFRLAAPYAGGIIDFYIDNKSAGRVTVPSTGGWQVYQSVTKNIGISPGKHYLKVVATASGYNFNYMDIPVGITPQITEVSTNQGGDTLKAKFNIKMQIPSNISALALKAQYNGSKSISILPGSFFKGDSTTLFFPLGEKVYKEYKLLLTYSGNNIMSTDSCLLKTFSDLQVTNNSNGLPAHINSGKIGADGFTLSLEFSKSIVLTDAQSAYFTLYKNGESVAFKNYSVSNTTVQFTLIKNIHYGDTVTISYTPGDIKTTDKGTLEGFSGFAVANQVSVPTWITIPGKIEAEKFVFKSGMQTENTNDLYGGQILGSINDGDWAEYAIKNDSSQTGYQISFRVAAPADGGIIDYYVDEKSAGNVTIPSTGSLQVYQLVVKDISITTGKHYLKAVATKGGFNFNYMNIYKIPTSIEKVTEANTTIYPNPVSNEITISSVGFKYNKIEIFDALGKMVISKETDEKPVFHLPVSLPDGMYFLKISAEKQYLIKKFMIVNK